MKKTVRNTLFATSVLAAGIAGVTAAIAATVDGSTGPTSTGTMDISLIIDNKLKVSNLDAVALGTFSGADLTGNDTVCVHFNQTGFYQVTIDSNDSAGTFNLDNAGTLIPYSITWDDGSLGAQAVTAGTPLAGQTHGNSAADDDCATLTADNATIAFTAAAADINAAGVNGTYSEEISITVGPNL